MTVTEHAPRTVVPRRLGTDQPRRAGSVRAPAPARRPPRGLALRGAALLAALVALLGTGIDGAVGRALGHGTGIGVVAGCVLGAVAVRRRDALRFAFAPPLVYAGLVLAYSLVVGSVPRTPQRQALELFTLLVLHAEVVVGATVLTLLVVLLRSRRRCA